MEAWEMRSAFGQLWIKGCRYFRCSASWHWLFFEANTKYVKNLRCQVQLLSCLRQGWLFFLSANADDTSVFSGLFWRCWSACRSDIDGNTSLVVLSGPWSTDWGPLVSLNTLHVKTLERVGGWILTSRSFSSHEAFWQRGQARRCARSEPDWCLSSTCWPGASGAAIRMQQKRSLSLGVRGC